MSMILDAMKRSKEADVQGEVPSVDTEHFVASGQTSGWTMPVTGIATVCMALILMKRNTRCLPGTALNRSRANSNCSRVESGLVTPRSGFQ